MITVGGTNGKGSTCAMLEAMLRAAGYRVGLYTSPHLLRYNERVRIDGREATDAQLVAAFERVEAARGDTSLTYFEFGTLAAALLFRDAGLEVAVLEVGLGGRLDAVNLFDPDCAIVTSIGLDHMEYLGSTRESIGLEKAGIFRSRRPAVVGDTDPPASLLEHAASHRRPPAAERARLRCESRRGPMDLLERAGAARRVAVAGAARRPSAWNAAAAMAALESLRERVPVDMGAIRRGLVEVALPGRFQVLPGRPVVVLDVAHNPQAAERLRDSSDGHGPLRDDLCGVRDAQGQGHSRGCRHTGRLRRPVAACAADRAARCDADDLRVKLGAAGVAAQSEVFDSVAAAYRHARERARSDDRILVFGSFHTVGDVLALMQD